MLLDIVQIQEHLPHRYPFLLIDRIMSFDPEIPAIVATKNVSISDPILQGHFPGNPIVPGVVLVEAMAQTAVVLGSLAKLYDQATHHCYFLKIDEAKFRSPAVPGDTLEIHVKTLRIGRIGKFYGEIRCGDDLKTQATITAGFFPKDKPVPGS